MMNFNLHNRRYIGSKKAMIEWIFSIIANKCSGNIFFDVFAGTGVVSEYASKYYKHIILNDFLYSNEIIYRAFFEKHSYRKLLINDQLNYYNSIDVNKLRDNYFSINFGGKFFSNENAKKIGFIREDLKKNKDNFTEVELNLLLTSLIYATDKAANTVGHYDAYFKKEIPEKALQLRAIEKIKCKKVEIYREDANSLVEKKICDIAYIDPPYNSRQYSRFYHVLENLAQWKKPKLHGVALKPDPENMSDYCRISAKDKFSDLISKIKSKYIVVSYNNTYRSKSSSSKNKISLDDINSILLQYGNVEIFKKKHKFFNSGKTDFNDHLEYLFVLKVK